MTDVLKITSNVSLSPYLSYRKEEEVKGQIINIIEEQDVGSISDFETPGKIIRGLKSRHIQLIALGSAIGTGLFIGSGGALSVCGPAPLLISYIIMSFFVWTIMNQLTEMVVLIPLPGEASLYSLTRTYVNRPLSFMSGWNLFYALAMIPPSEITACALLIQYWTDANSAIFISIFIACSVMLTMLPVKFFGESEFWVCMIKILTITGLIIVGIVIFFGGGPSQHHVLGFHYWKTPGAFNHHLTGGNTGKFLAVWTAIIKSGFSFVLVPETVTSCSAESVNPRRNMPRACQRFVYRLALFYVVGVLVVGVVVGYDDSDLMNAVNAGKSNAAASPFVIGIKEAGIKVLPHIINACILTSAYSCGTGELYGCSRTLYSMAMSGDAPKIFAKVNRYGVPYYSTAVASLFTLLAYLNCSKSSSVVFNWLSNIATISGFVSWVFVSLTYLRFRNVIDILDLNDRVPFRRPFQRFFAYLSAGFFSILGLTNGYAVFIEGNWNVSDFFASYVTIGFVLVLFIGSTAYYREFRFRNPKDIEREILPKIDIADEEERNEIVPVPKNWIEKIWYFII
ncbi:LAFE_0H00650g1_1 [Lachancea fermentati]|uniref:LAFE_0H00650g1_1 n=1 Tax=Lachancea fermentati TaxID=4955 RepID=A0A1G4MJ54_LACFM|nr:LAFE_0H00650g1_1 [Lachancea fermentati]